jgi:hypothetical protein
MSLLFLLIARFSIYRIAYFQGYQFIVPIFYRWTTLLHLIRRVSSSWQLGRVLVLRIVVGTFVTSTVQQGHSKIVSHFVLLLGEHVVFA